MTAKAPTPIPEGVIRPEAPSAPPKIKDWDLFDERNKQRKLFTAWCERKGYYPHTKYLEAWMEAAGVGYD